MFGKFWSWVAAGAVAGYAAVRTSEAVRELRAPAPALARDPAAYGTLRRELMLAGMARSLATLGAAAYAIGPLVDARDGRGDDAADADAATESRVRRLGRLAIALAATTAIELPSDFVEGFALERRYGLSKQTPGAWLGEQAKGFGLSVAIGLPLLELLSLAVARAPRSWPLLATAGTLPLLVLANVVAPTFIAPLFNTFEPIEGAFADRIRALAARYGAGDATILRVDMSKQTEKANAYVTGLFGTKRIVIGDTLLDRFEPDETIFVVAHELGHYVARDVWRAVAIGTATTAATFFGARALANRANGSLATSVGLARLFFAISLCGTLARPIVSSFSRGRERAADRFAIGATADAASGAAAFERLRETNMAEAEQPRWMEVLFSTHPSLRSRIDFLHARAEGAAAG